MRIFTFIIFMGNTFQCCRKREQLADLDGIGELDAQIVREIQLLRKEHVAEVQSSYDYKNGFIIYRGMLDSNSMRCGYGELYKLGLSFFGDFKQDKPDGYGILIKDSQQYYKGEFKKGVYHGRGRQYSHKHQFEGEYENGFRKKGILKTNDFTYQGSFHKNIYEGYGVLKLMNGTTYEGHFQGGKFTGNGFLNYKNGNKYEGSFKDGSYDGLGQFTWADGVSATCSYSQGNRTSRKFIKLPFGRINKKSSVHQLSQQSCGYDSDRLFMNKNNLKVVNGDGMMNLF